MVHRRVRLPAAGRRVRAGQQHHAAEAEPGGARARPGDRQQGARAGDAASCWRPQHAVRRHRRHRRRPAAAGGPHVPRRRPGARRSSRRRWPARSSTQPASSAGPAKAWITITELADTLVREHGLAFGAAHGDRPARGRSARPRIPSASLGGVVAEASAGMLGGADPTTTTTGVAAIAEPASTSSRSGRPTAARRPRRPGGRSGVSRAALDDDRAWLNQFRAPAGVRGRRAEVKERGTMSDTRRDCRRAGGGAGRHPPLRRRDRGRARRAGRDLALPAVLRSVTAVAGGRAPGRVPSGGYWLLATDY